MQPLHWDYVAACAASALARDLAATLALRSISLRLALLHVRTYSYRQLTRDGEMMLGMRLRATTHKHSWPIGHDHDDDPDAKPHHVELLEGDAETDGMADPHAAHGEGDNVLHRDREWDRDWVSLGCLGEYVGDNIDGADVSRLACRTLRAPTRSVQFRPARQPPTANSQPSEAQGGEVHDSCLKEGVRE